MDLPDRGYLTGGVLVNNHRHSIKLRPLALMFGYRCQSCSPLSLLSLVLPVWTWTSDTFLILRSINLLCRNQVLDSPKTHGFLLLSCGALTERARILQYRVGTPAGHSPSVSAFYSGSGLPRLWDSGTASIPLWYRTPGTIPMGQLKATCTSKAYAPMVISKPCHPPDLIRHWGSMRSSNERRS